MVLEDVSGHRGVVVSSVGSPIWGGGRYVARWRAERVAVVEGDNAYSKGR
jgi:hypothetical protein